MRCVVRQGVSGSNITGAVNAERPDEIYAVTEDKVNAQSTIKLWEKIEAAHPGKRIVHICDNAAYYHSRAIKNWLKAHSHVQVKYLPPYSPNLNPIERVWKLVKKEKINSFWYESFDDFKQGAMDFFNHSYLWTMERRATAEMVSNSTFQNSRLRVQRLTLNFSKAFALVFI